MSGVKQKRAGALIAPVAALFLALAVPGCGGGGRQRGEAPNLLLLSVDTLRADRIGAYGYGRASTRNIDRIAREGFLFERAFVQRGATWPSLTSIMTGLYPTTHGVVENGYHMDKRHTSLAELLAAVGYENVAFMSNACQATWNGFEEVSCSFAPEEFVEKHGRRRVPRRLLFSDVQRDRDRLAAERAVEWLDRWAKEGKGPFFVWVHLIDPHHPYTPADAAEGPWSAALGARVDGSNEMRKRIFEDRVDLTAAELSHINRLYDMEVTQSDANVGIVLEALDRLGLSRETVVVFASDHGEDLYEHNYYFDHYYSIYDSSLRVPLIVRFPERVPVGRYAGLVESVDIAPTLLELLSLPVPEEMEGRSRAQVFADSAPAGGKDSNGAAYAGLGHRLVYSVRTARWRLVRNLHDKEIESGEDRKLKRIMNFYPIEKWGLFDLEAEPVERRNVAAAHPEVAIELQALLDAWLRERPLRPAEQKIPAEVKEELRALGYLD